MTSCATPQMYAASRYSCRYFSRTNQSVPIGVVADAAQHITFCFIEDLAKHSSNHRFLILHQRSVPRLA